MIGDLLADAAFAQTPVLSNLFWSNSPLGGWGVGGENTLPNLQTQKSYNPATFSSPELLSLCFTQAIKFLPGTAGAY